MHYNQQSTMYLLRNLSLLQVVSHLVGPSWAIIKESQVITNMSV